MYPVAETIENINYDQITINRRKKNLRERVFKQNPAFVWRS
jgi:hypothetical protein